MHATVGEKTHEVNGVVCLDGGVHRLDENRILLDATILACVIDTRELLVHDTTGPHVEMSDLGIAHLTIGKANIASRCTERHVRTRFPQLVEIRFAGKRDGISGAIFSKAEAIHDH